MGADVLRGAVGSDGKVSSLGVDELGIHPIDPVLFRCRELGAAPAGVVQTNPEVVLEAEGFGRGAGSNVYAAARPIIAPEGDEVVLEAAVAAAYEGGVGCFLEDPDRPPGRVIDRIVANGGTVHTDEGDGRHASNEGAALDCEVASFPSCCERSEVWAPRAAA